LEVTRSVTVLQLLKARSITPSDQNRENRFMCEEKLKTQTLKTEKSASEAETTPKDFGAEMGS
jgi:hypothetical protein